MLDQLRIGAEFPPFIIAELSGNHNRSLERALALVDAAAEAGASAVKLQTYTPDTMTLDLATGEFFVSEEGSLWKGRSLYDLYGEAHTPWEWHAPIMERARQLGMVCFSSAFDATSIDFLESLGVPCYKIASQENTDLPLIRKAAATGKPLIISTGMATLAELDETVRTARSAGCRELVLLKCTSNYPADPRDSNLRTIPHMRELFGALVGLSDHTLGIGAAVASIALGAAVIEKHLTLSRAEGGVDAAFSLEPAEFKSLVEESNRVWQALGGIHYGHTAAEEKSLKYRRSLYVVRDVAAGEAFTSDNVRAIRPGLGLPPKYLNLVLGRVCTKDVTRGTPLHWDLLGSSVVSKDLAVRGTLRDAA
jgi:pseudaminic acid synthase